MCRGADIIIKLLDLWRKTGGMAENSKIKRI